MNETELMNEGLSVVVQGIAGYREGDLAKLVTCIYDLSKIKDKLRLSNTYFADAISHFENGVRQLTKTVL